jgi:Mce-associated membrane protein
MTRANGWLSAPVLSMSALAAALVATGAVLLATTPSSAAASDNRAVIDGSATAAVIGQVDTALVRVLSYSYKNPGATHAAAEQSLVGDAAHQYQVLFDALERKAGSEQLTLTAKIVNAGVTSLTATHAELLVFLDQTSTRASDGTSSASAAQLRIAATRVGGSWKISELVPL